MFDDLTSFVVDVGTHSTRFGYGGDDSPKIIAPSYVSAKISMGEQEKQISAGQKNLNIQRGDLQINSIFKTNGDKISSEIDQNYYETFLEEIIGKQLRVNTQDYSLMFSQDVNLKPSELLAQRQKIANIAFEKLRAPNIFFLKSPVLACFATGRSTAIVVDSGENSTRVTAVHEGFVLNKNSKIINCGGKQLTQQFEKYVEKQIGAPLLSRFELSQKSFTSSFLNYHKKALTEDIKLSCSPNSLSSTSEQNQQSFDQVMYELPDKQMIKIQKSQIKDIFISPSEEHISIPTTIVETINNTDVDIKRQLFSNILMTGGNFLYNGQGLQNQVISNVMNLAPPNVKIKSVSLCSNSERRTLSWIGGSIVSCLSAFQSYWIGREEYQNGGINVLEKKCL